MVTQSSVQTPIAPFLRFIHRVCVFEKGFLEKVSQVVIFYEQPSPLAHIQYRGYIHLL